MLDYQINDLVSIIIPAFNSADYLEKSVGSVQKQTYSQIQIILVNDGSTDNTGDVCKKLAKNDERIVVIDHTANMGQTITRNDGVASATGKWLTFLDSDDEFETDAIESMLNMADDDVDVVFAGFTKVFNHSKECYYAGLSEGIYSRDEFVCRLYDEIPASVLTCIGSKIYRTSSLINRKNSIRNEVTTNFDMAFVIDALLASRKVAYLNKSVYNYIQNKESITHSYRDNMFSRICESRKLIPELLETCHCYNERIVYYQRTQLDLASASLFQEIRFGKGFQSYKYVFDGIIASEEFQKAFRVIRERDHNVYYSLFSLLLYQRRYFVLFIYYELRKIYGTVKSVIRNNGR